MTLSAILTAGSPKVAGVASRELDRSILIVACGAVGVVADEGVPPDVNATGVVVNEKVSGGGASEEGGAIGACAVAEESAALACFSASISSARILVSPVARAAADFVELLPCLL